MDEKEDLVLPHKSEDLVKLLNKLYPEKSPELKDDTIRIPKCSEIYISTQTKIAYISEPINLNEMFWKIQYWVLR